VQKRRRQVPASECHTDFDLISLLLPPNPQSSFNNEDDSDTEENVREATLLLLRLTFAQTHSRLENVNQELELLRVAPTPPPQRPIDDGRGKGKESEDMWRLDPPVYGSSDGKELLLDENGKVSPA
jgi:immunoglobulin-binding protein 1